MSFSVLPIGWSAVPFTDKYCIAQSSSQATPDLTSIIGPLPSARISGRAYSGETFMSGSFIGN